jgi:hypothetical protein
MRTPSAPERYEEPPESCAGAKVTMSQAWAMPAASPPVEELYQGWMKSLHGIGCCIFHDICSFVSGRV